MKNRVTRRPFRRAQRTHAIRSSILRYFIAAPSLISSVPSRTTLSPQPVTPNLPSAVAATLVTWSACTKTLGDVNGKRVRVKRRGSRVELSGLPTGRYTVRIVATRKSGRRVVVSRSYRTCVPSGRALRESARPGAAAPQLRAISYLCGVVGRHLVSPS